jgi:DNA-binding XRE family transcriptional regulator
MTLTKRGPGRPAHSEDKAAELRQLKESDAALSRQARAALGISQAKLGELLDVTRWRVAQVEQTSAPGARWTDDQRAKVEAMLAGAKRGAVESAE